MAVQALPDGIKKSMVGNYTHSVNCRGIGFGGRNFGWFAIATHIEYAHLVHLFGYW